jgi:hypothetical protein
MDNDEEDAAHRLLLSHPKMLSLIFRKPVLAVRAIILKHVSNAIIRNQASKTRNRWNIFPAPLYV